MKLARINIDQMPNFVLHASQQGWVPLVAMGIDAKTIGEAVEAVSTLKVNGDLDLDLPQFQHLKSYLIPSSEAVLLCPTPSPSKVIAIGRNYKEHVEEASREMPSEPLIFAKLTSSLNGPTDDVIYDTEVTSQLDYEGELAVVIGARTKGATLSSARSSIFGYAVANDFTARDRQMGDGQWTRGKGMDTYGPIGPWITTADEVPIPEDLVITTRVDGELRQHSSVAQMIFGLEEIISHITQGITLEPGDVILTGTPSGVGLGMMPPQYLTHGSVVECEIEPLGAIRNMIRDSARLD